MTIYDELDDIQGWANYFPLDNHYYSYNTNVIFARCKISDLYYQISNARMSLHYYCDYDKYSISADDDISILNTKKYFLENALLYYNFSVDYLWQVLWLYFYDDIDKELPTDELYQKLMKRCDLETLMYRLTLAQETKIVDVLKENFTDRNEVYKDIRYKYNYLKHRAVFHTPELGINPSVSTIPIPLIASVEGKNSKLECFRIPLISRTELKSEEFRALLVKFDKQFVKVCNYFFDLIMPKEFRISTKVGMEVVKEFTLQHLDKIRECSKKEPELITTIPCEVYMKKIENN